VSRLAACLLALLLVAGCGGTRETREPDVVVREATTPADETPARGRSDAVHLWVVTHGQASSAFWTKVRNGIEAARRQMGIDVTYRSPDVYDVDAMRELIEQAVASNPDGLVVSIPSPELEAPIRAAVKAGIPVVSINSGSDVARRVGTLAHIGQPEELAGYKAGKRLAAAGAHTALCVNHEVGNEALDLRCAGFDRAMRESGGSSRVIAIDTNEDLDGSRERIRLASGRPGVDAVLTLNGQGGELAAEVAPAGSILATFDYSPVVLGAIRSGRIEFAVDQQPYLQGYLPIVFLTELVRYGLFPAQGDVIATGPNFVTAQNADQAERLSEQGIR
jgi:simple sugar transport system substrate-binding protein